jgi:hypothetical protein
LPRYPSRSLFKISGRSPRECFQPMSAAITGWCDLIGATSCDRNLGRSLVSWNFTSSGNHDASVLDLFRSFGDWMKAIGQRVIVERIRPSPSGGRLVNSLSNPKWCTIRCTSPTSSETRCRQLLNSIRGSSHREQQSWALGT